MEAVKRDKILLIAGALVGGAVLSYFFVKRRSSNDERSIDTTIMENKSQTMTDSQNISILVSKLYVMAEEEKKSGFQNKRFIIDLIKMCVDSIRNEALAVYNYSNTQKRKNFEDITAWSASHEKCQTNVEKLFKKSFSWLCKELNIDEKELEGKIEFHSMQDPQFGLMIQCVIENLKVDLKSKRKAPPSREELLEFLNYQIRVYEKTSLADFTADNMQEKLEQKVVFVAEKACWKTGLEEGDLVFNKEIISDPEFIEKQKELKSLIEKDEQNFIN